MKIAVAAASVCFGQNEVVGGSHGRIVVDASNRRICVESGRKRRKCHGEKN